MDGKTHRVRTPADWENLPEEELLKLRVRDLGLKIEGSPLEPCIHRLYLELEAKGIAFRPPCYLADEWLCPDRVPRVGIPFYLAHKRLKHLEQKMMLEVEGATDDDCLQLLRHETGHAVNYAYVLFKRTRWRELFGPFNARYPANYESQPYSRRYVNHLQDNYAQAHPDEDWAETFAVWLDPESDWKERYRDWPAIKKLNYADHLMREIGPKPPVVTEGGTYWSADRMTSTLDAFYRRRRDYLGEDFPGFYDSGLLKIFPDGAAPQDSHPKASVFLRHHRRQIINSVATWTGQRKFDIDNLLRKLIRRCDALGLTMERDPAETAVDVAAYVTAVITNVCRFFTDTEKK